MKTIQGLYDASYILDKGKPRFILFSRDKAGKKNIEITESFLPYFYVEEKEFLSLKFNQTLSKNLVSFNLVEDKEDILNKETKLIKIVLKDPTKVYETKQLFQKTWEADVLFTNRYIIDKLKLEPGKNRLAYFDIETDSEQGFPNYKNPTEPILFITLYDNFGDTFYQWSWHPEYIQGKNLSSIEGSQYEHYKFTSEESMLIDFLDKVQELQPDYFLAWNVFFDISYLSARLERLQLLWQFLSPLYSSKEFLDLKNTYIQVVKWQEGKGMTGKKVMTSDKDEKSIRILGTQYFDLLTAYRAIIGKEEASWKLDDVAFIELGSTKSMKGSEVGKVWRVNPEKVAEYNLMDVVLIKKLDEKLKIFQKYDDLKNTASLIDINSALSSGKIMDMYLLKNYSDKYIFPSKNYNQEKQEVAGGFVRIPISGVHKNIAVLDFSACYPSVIKAFNLSPDVYKGVVVYHNDNTIDEKDQLPKEMGYKENGNVVTFLLDTDKYKADISIDMSKKGILAETLDKLIALRSEAKKDMKKYEYGTQEYEQLNKRQESYKPVINGAFGVMGFSGFRLYNNAIANAITAFSRLLSKFVGHRLKEKGWTIVAGDTDSIFLSLKSNNLDENLNEINNEVLVVVKKAIEDFIGLYLPEKFRKNHSVTMDCDKIYSSLLLLDVRKRYIGELKLAGGKPSDNKLHFMGLDVKRNNCTKIAKKAQLDVSLSLLHNKDIFPTIKKQYQNALVSTEIEDFKLPAKLEKEQEEYKSKTPAVKASIWSNKNLGKNYKMNSKFSILYIKENKNIETPIIAFDDLLDLDIFNIQIDRNYYLEDIYNKIDNVVRAIPDVKKINDALYMQYLKRNHDLGAWL